MQGLSYDKGNPELISSNEKLDKSNVYNYPNPFNDKTTICFSIDVLSDVVIEIYDITGKAIWSKTLLNNELNFGINKYIWNGVNNSGCLVADGVYIMAVASNGIVVVDKIAVVHEQK
jgi:flagellar hook assembly protein FlgD